MTKIRSQVRGIQRSLQRQVVDVRGRIERIAREPHIAGIEVNIEKRVETVLSSLQSQDFLQSPRVQELMSRVRERLARNEIKSSPSNDVTASSRQTAGPAESAKTRQTTKVGRFKSLSSRESLEQIIESRTPQMLRDVTSKLTRSILERAQEIQKSLQTSDVVVDNPRTRAQKPLRTKSRNRKSKPKSKPQSLPKKSLPTGKRMKSSAPKNSTVREKSRR